MARELKIGIAVIGLLLLVFCGLLAKRLTRPTKLPLTSIAASANAKPNSTAAKPATPVVRPTMIPPQAEPNKSQDYSWNNSAGQTGAGSIDNPQSQNRYAGQDYSQYSNQNSTASTNPNGAQPNLLAAPLPIQDLENKQPSGSNGAVPYQSAYGGASDATAPKTSSAANAQAPVDPFQYAPAKSAAPAAANTVPPTPYQDYPPTDHSKSPAMNGQYGQNSAGKQSDAAATDNYQWTQSAGATSTQQYSNDAYSNPPSSRTKSPNIPAQTIPAQYGGEYSNNTQPAANNTSWSGNSVTNNVVPSTPAAPVERNGEKYSVQPNDTFWTISERAYGTGAYFKALYEYNRRKHRQADELVVGQDLLVPDENVLRRHYPDLCPRPRKTVASTEQRLMTASTKMRGTGRVYQVVEGDTLYDIAKFELGKSSRWAEIYDLNRDLLGDDFDYLRPGTELILPSDNSSQRGDSVTRQPEQAIPNNSWR
jgi:nucleoid-associated protein YgaU